MTKGRRYKITWVDIDQNNAWCSIQDIKKDVKELREHPLEMVWMFVMETKDFYVFSSGVDSTTGDYFDRIIMPKGVVKKIQLIKENNNKRA
jgi:hypothetical protein